MIKINTVSCQNRRSIVAITKAAVIASLIAVSAAASAAAPVKTTKDWSRKALQVNPVEAGEAITKQWQGGQWSAGDLNGYYRFIVTQADNEHNRLYVQWWQRNADTDSLAYSISIRELNEHSEYRLSIPVCADTSCQTVSVKAENTVEETEQQFLLDLSRFGEYRLSI